MPGSRLGHLGYLLADHRMICFSSNTCTTYARRGVPPQREHGAPGGATQRQRTCRCRVSCGRPGWRSGRPRRALQTIYGAWQRRAAPGWCRGESWTACQHDMRHLPSSVPPRSCCPGTLSAGPVLLRPISPAPRTTRKGRATASARAATSPSQRAKHSSAFLQVALCLASASHEHETSSDCMCNPSPP